MVFENFDRRTIYGADFDSRTRYGLKWKKTPISLGESTIEGSVSPDTLWFMKVTGYGFGHNE